MQPCDVVQLPASRRTGDVAVAARALELSRALKPYVARPLPTPGPVSDRYYDDGDYGSK
jgi:hypothetical protein